MNKEQEIQESQYHFPYHHLARYGNGKFSQTKELRWGLMYMAYISYILKELKKLEFKHLLDIGCGDGKLVLELQKFFPKKIIEGVDYSDRAISFAKAFSPKNNFYVKDITKEKISDKNYDVATLIEVLEHIPPGKTGDFIKGIADNLNKNGKLILTVPSDNTPVSTKHYQHFNLSKLKETLSPHFEIEFYEFLNKQGLVDKITRSLLTNRLFILNQQRLINFIYRFYIKNLLLAKPHNGGRIFAIFTKK